MAKGTFLVPLIILCASIFAEGQSRWVELVVNKNQDKIYPEKEPSVARVSEEASPIPRYDPCAWTDKKGGIWLYGGIGQDINSQWGTFQDLWYLNSKDKKWVTVKGTANVTTNAGTESSGWPVGRRDAATWTDKKGNLWLYGGRSTGDYYHLDDLWEFNLKSTAWINHSDGIKINEKPKHASKPSFESVGVPGSRSGSVTWIDNKGDLWLFGGFSNTNKEDSIECYNDLWRFDISKNIWYNVKGNLSDNLLNDSTTVERGEDILPSGRYNAAGWFDEKQKQLWIYGGIGYGTSARQFGGLSDMWGYDLSKNLWQCVIKEFRINAEFNIGTAEQPSPKNNPGKRVKPTRWIDKKGNLFLMGGHNNFFLQNRFFDEFVWKFDTDRRMWSIVPDVPAVGIGGGETFTDAAGEVYMFGGLEYQRKDAKSQSVNKIFKFEN